ncbi:MAG: thiolase family protein [Chloroflexota bacterium]
MNQVGGVRSISGVAIVGAGESPYHRHPAPDTTTRGLLADAARRALDNAGLRLQDVDGLAVSSFSLAPDHAIDLAWRLGLKPRWLMEDTNGGASAVNMLQHAARAVQAGDAELVLVLSGDVFSPAGFASMVDNYNSATRDHLAPLPHGGPNGLFALLTQRHMAAHGLSREDYGRLVVAQRAWASGNPGAVYRDPLTLADYLAAPMVADPLCRLDCVPVVAGADAVLVAQPDRAGKGKAVKVTSVAGCYNPDQQRGDGLRTGLAEIAPSLWEAAEVGPADIGVASVYDDFPVMVLVQLADLGFVAGGDVGRFIRENVACRRLPLNTSGGQLSAGQAGAAGGLHGLVEVVRQLRGEAEGRQVQARFGLVTGYGMVLYQYGACANAVVLERPA